MSKIYYDSDTLKVVSNELDNASNILSRARNECSFNTPSSFSYYSYVKGLSSVIYKLQNTSKNLSSWLISSETKFEQQKNNLINSGKNIEVVKINKRSDIIR